MITKSTRPDLSKIGDAIVSFLKKNEGKKKEIAFYGGSFTLLSYEEQSCFLHAIKPYLTEIQGVRISTRPDGISDRALEFCLANGVKTIELGIQSFSDQVLQASKRPYNSDTALKAIEQIKASGLSVGIQLMPGLPLDNHKELEITISQTIDALPEFARIYPTVVLKGTELEELYKSKMYKPMSLENSVNICASMVKRFHLQGIKVAKIGLHSGLNNSDFNIVAGPYHESFGELVNIELYYQKFVDEYVEGYTIVISDKALSMFMGFNRQMLMRIKKSLSICTLPIIINHDLKRDDINFVKVNPSFYW